MSNNRKMLKVLSLIQFVVAIIALVLGGITLAGAGSAGDGTVTVLGSEISATLWTVVTGALIAFTGLLSLISSVLGIRGANRPSRLGGHGPISILAALLGLVAMFLGSNFGSLSTPTVTMVAFALGAFVFALDARVRHEMER